VRCSSLHMFGSVRSARGVWLGFGHGLPPTDLPSNKNSEFPIYPIFKIVKRSSMASMWPLKTLTIVDLNGICDTINL